MSNPFDPPKNAPPEKSSVASNSNPFETSENSAPSNAGSSSQSFAVPPGIPLNRPAESSTSKSNPPAPPPVADAMDPSIPDEAPPAYSSAPGPNNSVSLQSGPSRMDFSGPPPMPDRYQDFNRPQIEQQITGVGYGYRPDPSSNSAGGGLHAQYTGFAPPPDAPPQKMGGGGVDYKGDQSGKPMSSQPTGSSSAGPSQAPDLSPTEIATPGRPLLRKGQLLVYPKNHYCQKCGNTGYKNNDPNNPHNSDWRKYGKAYNSALQASYKSSTGPYANPATQSSSNFQRPLPDLSRPPQGNQQHLPPPPGAGSNGGKWNQHPGNHAPPMSQGQGWAPPQQQWGPPPPQPHIMPHGPFVGGLVPRLPGGLVVRPGDPRIGGRPCWKCGAEGRALSFFGFDDGPCRECRGVGRLFI